VRWQNAYADFPRVPASRQGPAGRDRTSRYRTGSQAGWDAGADCLGRDLLV
jgi:hypothetical protein